MMDAYGERDFYTNLFSWPYHDIRGALALTDQHSEGFGLDKHKSPIGTLF